MTFYDDAFYIRNIGSDDHPTKISGNGHVQSMHVQWLCSSLTKDWHDVMDCAWLARDPNSSSFKTVYPLCHSVVLWRYWRHTQLNTVQSRKFDSWLFEVPFRPSQCVVVKVVSTVGTEFGCIAHLCIHTCLWGIPVMPFSRFLCVFMCIFTWFKYVL
jgi:hypothetical protein